MHIVFGMVVVPFLKKVVMCDHKKAQKAFEYIEKMECSGDSQISEVVEFTILESLLDIEDTDVFDKCKELMGNETKAALEEVKKWIRKQ